MGAWGRFYTDLSHFFSLLLDFHFPRNKYSLMKAAEPRRHAALPNFLPFADTAAGMLKSIYLSPISDIRLALVPPDIQDLSPPTSSFIFITCLAVVCSKLHLWITAWNGPLTTKLALPVSIQAEFWRSQSEGIWWNATLLGTNHCMRLIFQYMERLNFPGVLHILSGVPVKLGIKFQNTSWANSRHFLSPSRSTGLTL